MKQNFDDWILKNPDLEIKMYNIETAKSFIKNEFDQYPEYRQELQNNDQPHYETLYWNRDIYNIEFNV